MTNDHKLFVEIVWTYYIQNKRDLPWRKPEPDGTYDPYKILVSEIMLQQTQASRVLEPYARFLSIYPTVQHLAHANQGDVINLWQGLGYNRRARYLYESAKLITHTYDGIVPDVLDNLVKLPGVGSNTAGAILAYAYNHPVIFIETNIRTVYIYHFYNGVEKVDDGLILEQLRRTIDLENPRNWYYALMDYGVYLKKEKGNFSRSSKHYRKQSRFDGSNRQLRGKILRLLSVQPHTKTQIIKTFADARTETVLEDLVSEKMIRWDGIEYRL